MFHLMFQAKYLLLLYLVSYETLKHLIYRYIKNRGIRENREAFCALMRLSARVHTRVRARGNGIMSIPRKRLAAEGHKQGLFPWREAVISRHGGLSGVRRDKHGSPLA